MGTDKNSHAASIFFSSFTSEHPRLEEEQPSELRRLREEAWQLGEKRGGGVWVAERSEPRLAKLAFTDPLAVTDTLVERVAAAGHFVCVLAGDRRGEFEHGTPISIAGAPSAVSHFEIELYQAALHQKPIHLFLLPGFSPGGRLESLLRLLSFALPDWREKTPKPRKDILAEIRRLLEGKHQISARQSLTAAFTSKLFDARGRDRSHEVLFLDGQHEARSNHTPDTKRVEFLLTDATQHPDMQKKLSRMWIAARELMSVNYTSRETFEPRLFALWNQVLGQWSSAAAWSGLHAHLFGGVVAALNSQSLIRKRLRGAGWSDLPVSEIQPPFGGLASAYYSVAKRIRRGRLQAECFARAVENIQQALSITPKDAGLYAVRGSIHLHQGRFFRAVDDYKEVVRRKEAQGASPAELADPICELGFALWCTGRIVKGERLLRQGLRELDAQGESGFLLRARRKLALICRSTGRLGEARETERLVAEAGERLKMFDQLRQLQERPRLTQFLKR